MKCQLDALLENLSTAVLVTDAQLKICYGNQAAEQLFGMSRQRLNNFHLCDLIDPNDQQTLNVLKQSLSPNFSGIFIESLLINPSPNKLISVSMNLSQRSDGQGCKGVIAEMRSLTHQQALITDHHLSDQHSAATFLIRNLAHEIKNPLGGIRGAAQLMEMDFADVDGLKDYTSQIIAQTDRLKDLVDRLLGPQKPGSKSKTNVHYLIEKVLSLVSLKRELDIKIQRDYDPSLPELLIDANGMEQVLLNIILNAQQAFESGHTQNPCIKILTRARHGIVIAGNKMPTVYEISISNNGPEIPKHLMQSIFYPMVTTKAKGTGLGLSISQNFIRQYRGCIVCTSTSDITTFKIMLPISSSRTNQEHAK